MKTTLSLLCLMLLAGCSTDRGMLGVPGIRNFDRVDERLFRGGQPSHYGIEYLKALGVVRIINLRGNDAWAAEGDIAKANGIDYVHIPLSGLAAPSQESLEKILTAIRMSYGNVYVHCAWGCERTGTAVAAYRIRVDSWSNAAALNEAKVYGLSPLAIEFAKTIKHFK